MSKKIFIAFNIMAILLVGGYWVSVQVQKANADSKGEILLEEILTEEFELVGKSNTREYMSLLFAIDPQFVTYDSYKFIDENGASYYISRDNGTLMKYWNEDLEETAIKNEETAGKSAVILGKKLFPDFFRYNYEYAFDSSFGDGAIIIKQLNVDNVFTGNYIETHMSNDSHVYKMNIHKYYDSDSELLSKEDIEEIAYQHSIYIIDCIKTKISGKKLSYLQNYNYSLSINDNSDWIISNIQKQNISNLENFNSNIQCREELEITSYTEIWCYEQYWWKVYIKNAEDNLGELYAGKNNSYTFKYFIDPRTGQILKSEVIVAHSFS